MHGGEAFVFTILFGGFFAMVFGIYYLRTRQNLAMIDKGMNPKEPSITRPAPYKNLKWALLLIGAGLGLFLAYILDEYVMTRWGSYVNNGITRYHREENPAIYFALIAIGGGLGLFGSYKMEKTWWDENKERL
jgi:hypothetical protein